MNTKSPITPPDGNLPRVDDNPKLSARNSRSGLKLFAVYLVAYVGFMALTAFSFESLKQPVLLGVNLAIVYGLGLIAGALVLAAIYLFLCYRNEKAQRGA